MNIYASGEAQSAYEPGNSIDAVMERVVGIVDLGPNNSNNNYGWCGAKAVISKDDTLYILDFPSQIEIRTWDGLTVVRSEGISMPWWPSAPDIDKYDLYYYNLSQFEH